MPESANQSESVQDRCRHLRSKEMFVEVPTDLSIPRYHSGHYWCVHSQNVLGPDGKVANEENCRPGRSCFESL
jgi:hypothetical protein